MAMEWFRGSPRAFKVLVASALIENIAFGLVLPLLSIYSVEVLGIQETLSGLVLAGYTITGIPAVIIGGMLADKIGRRVVLLISLSLMSITFMSYMFATGFLSLIVIVLADSFVGSLYMPAANAMIADVIPQEERPKAYSTLRVAWNTGMFIGPSIAMILVSVYSIRELFLFGAIILAGAFFMNLVFIPETKPSSVKSDEVTFGKVMAVSKNRPFLMIVSMTGVLWFFMTQWVSVLPLYAINDLQLDITVPSLLFAINALMVVGLQLWVTSCMVKFRRSMVLLLGQMIVSVGFALIYFGNDLYSLIACIVLITVGEIIYMSIISAIIADLSPEAERGVYMGFAGFIQSLGMGVGLFFGMWLLDIAPEPEWLWPIFGMIGAITSVGYLIFARMISPEQDHPSKYCEPIPIKTIPIEKA